ncbi:cytochrome c biogenesis CcdA family protein [Pseudoxanthomonas sp. SL93]|uniref:cytochrome c biogenesis CcdA family protein n=1 Tax=Pseudoxanthomonas sp. SL93 TaxID=2995142 RepID=UPI00226E8BF9|nr:cytochrome c biogenesis CcdA family protein [Pseudoxanthomonas sp. SL93]WAC62833.1 cytochrome c biogenesis CcdA family protein [Pseudoxanthomonas sp. SL93]
MIEYTLAALAGMATILSPCILPVLPIVLATGTGRDRATPLWIIGGFVGTFAASGILLGTLAASSGELQAGIRTGSIIVLMLAGLACFRPTPFERAVAWTQQQWSRIAPPRMALAGIGGRPGALIIGASLGLAWTPCAGPVLASVLALAASSQQPAKASALLGVYAVGAGIPMLLIAYGGHWINARLPFLQRHADLLRKCFGAVAVAVAVLQLLQYDVFVSAWATQWLPPLSQGL